MQYLKCDINTYCIGQAVSIAAILIAAGTKGKRTALPNTDIMIHEFSGGAQGKANDIFLTVDRLKKLYDKMATHYVKFTGQKLAKVKKDMERDHHMSAEEAVKYGLVDKVIIK